MEPGSVVTAASSTSGTAASTGFTDVTSDLYYAAGHLGTLKIPANESSVKIYEGTGSSILAKGTGHFKVK